MVLGLDSKVPGKMFVAEMVQMMGLLVAHTRAWAQLVRDLGSGVVGTICVVVALVNQKNCSSMAEVV